MAESNLRAATQRSSMLELADGTTLEFRPLIVRDWATLEEEALKDAKRQFLQFKLSTLDLLGPDVDVDQERDKFWKQAEAMAIDDLPEKETVGPAFSPSGKPIKAGGLAVGDTVQTKDGDAKVHSLVAGIAFVRQTMPYVNWWLGRTIKGQFMAVWLSVRKARPTMTFDDCCDIFTKLGEEAREEAADLVGQISRPTVGNE